LKFINIFPKQSLIATNIYMLHHNHSSRCAQTGGTNELWWRRKMFAVPLHRAMHAER
jgi:hypothetical protein